MKLLESSNFEAINSALFVETCEAKIVGRIESYSCKMIGTEKQLFKKFNSDDGRSPHTLVALSPPQNGYGGYGLSPQTPKVYARSWSSSTGGGGGARSSSDEEELHPTLCDTISRKTLFYLISTLNSAFSDYTFSDAKSCEFNKEPSLAYVTSNIDGLLSVTATERYSKVHDALWVTLNQEIELRDCEIYSYNPDLSSDPFGEDGCLWSFNYFFYNRRLKRIVLFTCRALSPFSQAYNESGPLDEEEENLMF
jgi:hypothetical protein